MGYMVLGPELPLLALRSSLSPYIGYLNSQARALKRVAVFLRGAPLSKILGRIPPGGGAFYLCVCFSKQIWAQILKPNGHECTGR